MQLPPVQIHPPAIAVMVPTEPLKDSPWTRATYDMRRSNTHFEEEESTLKRSPSVSDLAKLSSDLMRVNQFFPEKDILMKRSSSLSHLEDLPNELIQAGRVENGLQEFVKDTLQKLPPSENFDDNYDNKLLEVALSIKPRDAFVTANQFGENIELTSNFTQSKSGLVRRALSRRVSYRDPGRYSSTGCSLRMIRQSSDRNPSGSFSKREIPSHPLRVKVKGLTTQPPSTPMFNNGCSDCVSSCLSLCLPLSHDQQLASLAARKEEVLRKVHAEFAAKNWSNSYNLTVEYDPIDHRLLFDGSMIEYDESGEFKEMCKTVAAILECTENSDELQADHLVSKHTRNALGIKGNKAVCLLTDKELHMKKTNDSINIFKIEDGNVNLEEVYDNFMKRHIELVRKFFAGKAMDRQSKRKWGLLDLETQINCFKAGWRRTTVTSVVHFTHAWDETPFKAVLHWNRVCDHCFKNIEKLRDTFVSDMSDTTNLELVKKDVEKLCSIAKGIAKAPRKSTNFAPFVTSKAHKVMITFNEVAHFTNEGTYVLNPEKTFENAESLAYSTTINLLDRIGLAKNQHTDVTFLRKPGYLAEVVTDKLADKKRIETSFENTPAATFSLGESYGDPGQGPSY
jgi:hypothetical protein